MRQDEQQAGTDHPEAVRSAPVPVPPTGDRDGRADRADVPEDVLDDRGTFDDPRVADDHDISDDHDTSDDRDATAEDRDATAEEADLAADDRDRSGDGRRSDTTDGTDRPEFHEPAPVPTAFGATTVGGAVAASALASGRPEDEPDPRTESTARPGDGAGGEREGWRADPTAEFRGGQGWEQRREDRAGGTEEPDTRADEAATAGYGSATPTMVDPDGVSPDADPAVAGAGAADAGSLETDGTARPAGSTVADQPATLFDPGTAQGFRDRWRDVQLRFVDDPRAAAGEAQSLVDEAIQALSSALTAQKRQLGVWQDGGSTDTEQLRVAVRQYRDFLDRVLGR